MPLHEIGKITHYFPKLSVAVLELSAPLRVGNVIKVIGREGSFTQPVDSMQIEHAQVAQALPGQSIGLKVRQQVHQGNKVFLLDVEAEPSSQPVPVGKITHYFPKLGVAVVELLAPLKVGQTIKIDRHEGSFTQRVTSMQIDRTTIEEAKSGQSVGLKVSEPVREGNKVYKIEIESEPSI